MSGYGRLVGVPTIEGEGVNGVHWPTKFTQERILLLRFIFSTAVSSPIVPFVLVTDEMDMFSLIDRVNLMHANHVVFYGATSDIPVWVDKLKTDLRELGWLYEKDIGKYDPDDPNVEPLHIFSRTQEDSDIIGE